MAGRASTMFGSKARDGAIDAAAKRMRVLEEERVAVFRDERASRHAPMFGRPRGTNAPSAAAARASSWRWGAAAPSTLCASPSSARTARSARPPLSRPGRSRAAPPTCRQACRWCSACTARGSSRARSATLTSSCRGGTRPSRAGPARAITEGDLTDSSA